MSHKQMTLTMQSDATFAQHSKATKRDVFLAETDKVLPWVALCEQIKPFYPKERAEGGRRPIGLERTLRIHFLQQWYAPYDPAVEEALYNLAAMRRFVEIDLGREAAPDEKTVCKFRHLLERNDLAAEIFATVSEYLKGKGMKFSHGRLVDATIIAAVPSTKTRDKVRDPAMQQTKKGNQWHFGMKAHIGADEITGLVHTVTTTVANVSDVTEVRKLLHGKERAVYADAGYTGAEQHAMHKRGRTWHIAAKRSKVKAIEDPELRELTAQIEHLKASIRANVEHPFRVRNGSSDT